MHGEKERGRERERERERESSVDRTARTRPLLGVSLTKVLSMNKEVCAG